MPKINVLDSSVYNLIAAGEVVERPASVIKELVENSIDANATIITIEVVGGGSKMMSVTDNGCGIDEDDLKKAFLPHATSKIKTGADLDAISTLGFRGEALASIGAVSKVTLISRTDSSDVGGIIEVEGGIIKNIGQTGAPRGTTIKVCDLFYNIPARQKFLKKEKAEELEITNLVSRLILANPNISFRYIADGRFVYQSTGASEDDAVFCVYGKDALGQTLKISGQGDGIEVHGVIGKASFSKPNRTYQTIVLNGRNINNTQISLAVTNAYGERLMKRQYPFFVLYVNISPESVDVNVHPNKLEVRFENGNNIFKAVFGACIRALDGNVEIRNVEVGSDAVEDKKTTNEKVLSLANIISGFGNTDEITVDEPQPQNSAPTFDTKCDASDDFINIPQFNPEPKQEVKLENFADSLNAKKQNIIDTISTYKAEQNLGVASGFGVGSSLLNDLLESETAKDITPQENTEPLAKINSTQQSLEIEVEAKNVGKLFNTYLMVSDNENLFLIDQHAAHERILFEKFKAEIESGELAVQPLLAPYVLRVNAQETGIIDENLALLSSLGFDISEFGLNTYKISAIPAIVAGLNFDKFFSTFLQENKRVSGTKAIDLIKDNIIELSCKSAVKAGFDLTESEIKSLLADMRKQNLPLYCPHGRPIIVKVTKTEIEKWFKRIV